MLDLLLGRRSGNLLAIQLGNESGIEKVNCGAISILQWAVGLAKEVGLI